MSYFTEILAETDDGWRARDLDVRDSATLEELAEVMRDVAESGREALAVIEHEDEWLGLVRLKADDEVVVFISNADAAVQSPFAEMFAEYVGVILDDYELEEQDADGVAVVDTEDDDSDDADSDTDDDEEESVMAPGLDSKSSWVGDADIFADRGVTAEDLIEQVDEYAFDPARVVAHIGEIVGFAEQLEAVR